MSDPHTPSLIGSVGLGRAPVALDVVGRYAYVTDVASSDLRVLDVSDPTAPIQVGRLGLGGGNPNALAVAGRYAYVTDIVRQDFKVIDVSVAAAPKLVASTVLSGGGLFGPNPFRLQVAGRYAYLIDLSDDELRTFDLRGLESSSLVAGTIEAGDMQVHGDLLTQGTLRIGTSFTIGSGGLLSEDGLGVSGTVALAADRVPASSTANAVQLYAEDVAGSAELRVRDESGNVTTLSPHNFSLVGGPSEAMAWSYYSESPLGRINVDMLRAVRTVERLSGEQLVYADNLAGPTSDDHPPILVQLRQAQHRNAAVRAQNAELRQELDRLERLMEALK